MSIRLRPIGVADHDTVLALNHDHVELLAPLDRSRLTALLTWADRGDVIEVDGQPAGFVLTMAPGNGYDSPNYQWFGERYGADFYYLDRIVIAESYRRGGVAGVVYDELERVASRYRRMALEVNVDPPNEASLAFHRVRGYREVARRGEPGHLVSLMARQLAVSGPGPAAAVLDSRA